MALPKGNTSCISLLRHRRTVSSNAASPWTTSPVSSGRRHPDPRCTASSWPVTPQAWTSRPRPSRQGPFVGDHPRFPRRLHRRARARRPAAKRKRPTVGRRIPARLEPTAARSFGRLLADTAHRWPNALSRSGGRPSTPCRHCPRSTPDALIGYSGMTLAGAIGISLTAVEPRITAAIIGRRGRTRRPDRGSEARYPTPSSTCSRGMRRRSHATSVSSCSTPSPRTTRCCTPSPAGTTGVPTDGSVDTGFFSRHLKESRHSSKRKPPRR